MSVEKLDIKFNNQIMDKENINKIAHKVNEIIEDGGGTEVVANPEGEASVNLTKLQVGDTIYQVQTESGTKYQHFIRVYKSKYSVASTLNVWLGFSFTLINDSNTAITTINDLKTAMGNGIYYSCNGLTANINHSGDTNTIVKIGIPYLVYINTSLNRFYYRYYESPSINLTDGVKINESSNFAPDETYQDASILNVADSKQAQ